MEKKYTYKVKIYCYWYCSKVCTFLQSCPYVILDSIKSDIYHNLYFKIKCTNQEARSILTILTKEYESDIEYIKKVWF